jgi:hypothetical protein
VAPDPGAGARDPLVHLTDEAALVSDRRSVAGRRTSGGFAPVPLQDAGLGAPLALSQPPPPGLLLVAASASLR